MAKENYALIIGVVTQDTTITKNEVGDPKNAIIPITSIRRGIYDKAGNFNPEWDNPILYTEDARMIYTMQNVKKNDVVLSKCVLITKPIARKIQCPSCGEIIEDTITVTFLYPVSIMTIYHAESTSAAKEYLLNFDVAEVSNTVKMIGRLTCDPTFTEFGNRCRCNYKIAVNRKLFVAGSQKDSNVTGDLNRMREEERSDYPYVASYGEVARNDYEQLQTGSLIYIDGYLHTMAVDNKIICPSCEEEIRKRAMHMYITPYSVEYLENCKLKESTRNLNKKIEDREKEESNE